MLPDAAHMAVTEYGAGAVVVFGLDGRFVRRVGDGVLRSPMAVAVSDVGEIVVADQGLKALVLFTAAGDFVRKFGGGDVSGVAVVGARVFAQEFLSERCVVYE
jgi:hypothetical protein